MEDKYHNWLKLILKEFAVENSNKLKRHNSSIKLTSTKRHSKSIIEYEPDYCFSFKTGKKSFEYIVLEFLDSQDDEGIFADIIECACIKNCRMLIFLAKDAEKSDRAFIISDIVSNLLDELNEETYLEVVTLHIPMNMNKEEVKKEIFNQIKRQLKLVNSS